MAKLITQYYTQFQRGLNRIMSASKIADEESPQLQNAELVENGIPAKRRGTDLVGNLTSGTVIGEGRLYTTTNKYHLRVCGTSLEKLSSGTWTPISGKTYNQSSLVNFVQIRGAAYTHDAVNSMGKYDGTTLSTPAYGVIAGFGILYAERHVASGNPAAPSRVYFSSPVSADNFTGLSGTATAGAASTITDGTKSWTTNEYQSLTITITAGTGAGQVRTVSSNTGTVITVSVAWTTTPDATSQYIIQGGDTIDIAKDDGQAVMGLAKFEEKLIIFKEHSIYQLTFDDSGLPVVVLISAAYGCVSHRSIESVENDVLFLAKDGVRSLGYVPNIPGVLRTNILSAKIRPETDNINPLYYQRSSAHYFNNYYILSFPQGVSTSNNRIVAFSLLYAGWVLWTGLHANCFNAFIESDNKERLYYGDELSAATYQLFADNYSDGANTAIDFQWYSKQFDLGAFDARKRFLFVDIQLRALTGTLDIDVIIDGDTIAKSAKLTSSFSGKDGYRTFQYRVPMYREDNGSTADVVATDDVRRIKLNKTGRTIQVKVSNNTVDETATLMGIAVIARTRPINSFDSTKVLY